MRSSSLVSAALTGACFLLAGSAAPAATPPRGASPASVGAHARHAKPTTCSTVAPNGFVAIPSYGDYAGALAGILGGAGNSACDNYDGILTGSQNKIGDGGYAIGSALAAGDLNAITSAWDMIGAGDQNSIEGYDAFVGAGELNDASAPGAFVGAGGLNFVAHPANPADGNVAAANDSFVGAGNLNHVSGAGSFIGAGGATSPKNDGPTGNIVAGSDAFLGAGEASMVAGSTAGVVAGFGNQASGAGAFVGAGDLNVASGAGAVVGGGGTADANGTSAQNVAAGVDAFVGAGDENKIGLLALDAVTVGGLANAIDAPYGAIGGGAHNVISAEHFSGAALSGVISGGDDNAIEATAAGGARFGTIAGGVSNRVSAQGATAGGGAQGRVSGLYAVVPGGLTNSAAGTGSFAAGTLAQALQDGAFVWSDGASTTVIKSSAPYQFVARASGGFYLYSNAAATAGVRLAPGSGAWASLSDRAAKTQIVAIDDEAVLAKVGKLPVSEWSYRSEDPRIRHVGPMAQDFYNAFGVGEDDRHITSIDEDGVALAAIKALRDDHRILLDQNREQQAEVSELRAGLARLVRLAGERGYQRVNPTTCSSNASNGFVAIPNQGDYAGYLSGILGGNTNTACDAYDGILAGQGNQIGNGGSAAFSAIGAGVLNAITAQQAMVGAGLGNSIEGNNAFVGAGAFNDASGAGAFVGAGGSITLSFMANSAAGTDSFVGAGAANQVFGEGSFIGAGGAATPDGDGSTGNAVSGNDAFIGAGEQNLVAGNTGAVVAGFRNQASGPGAFVGAGDLNVASGAGAVVGGGGTADVKVPSAKNLAAGVDAFVGAGDENNVGDLALDSVAVGGVANSIDAPYGAIGGGAHNVIGARKFSGAAFYDVVAGGDENAIEAAGAGAARYATIAGGVNNRVSGLGATAGGGDQNSVSGPFAVVPGGRTNTAAGTGSFAAGISALALHDGAFVWSDGAGTTAVKSSAPYQFVARASGGFYLYSNAAATSGVRLAPGSGAWASLSDRGAKTHVVAVDDEALLAEVGNLPVGTWSYRSEDPRIRHVGPMAQDFHKAFGVGDDDRHITSIDEAGVVLAATKALRNHDLAFYDQESGRQAELRALRDGIARVARLASADAPAQHAARKIRRRRGGASPITCSTVASGAFVAIPYYGDYAASLSGIGGGTGNTACDSNDGILAGQQNAIGDAGNAGVSAVGAGNQNAITAAQVMIGAGTLNSVEGSGAFIGAGELNEASGYLAFVGGGGVNDAATPADGNVASGTGSFVGAGDLNRASGMGSFIGAGGAATPHSDGLTGNAVSGNDALIGAGEQNLVAGSTGAVVAGFRNQASGAGAFVGAGDLNVASGAGAVVGGGGTADANISAPQNVAAGVDAFVGAGDENYIGALALASVAVGGAGNSIDAPYGAIGGGAHNAIGAQNFAGAALFDVIAGGDDNAIEATVSGGARYATIVGGAANRVSAQGATVGGGTQNRVSGLYAVVPGGRANTAAGTGSFAAGISALALHDGTFVWSDGASPTAVKSSAPYQFVARSSGGFFLYSNASATAGVRLAPGSGAWASLGDRAAATALVAVDDAAVLAKVGELPVSAWSYRSEDPRVRHVGPMAQDFYEAFGVGEDDRHIASIDEDGVALAATKALRDEDLALRDQSRELRAELRELRAGLSRVRRLVGGTRVARLGG